MSLDPQPIGEIPEMTVRVTRAAFRNGSIVKRLGEEFGTLYTGADSSVLFPKRGRPAPVPWRLALVSVFQFLEDLANRLAADQVRARIDWKYALGQASSARRLSRCQFREYDGSVRWQGAAGYISGLVRTGPGDSHGAL